MVNFQQKLSFAVYLQNVTTQGFRNSHPKKWKVFKFVHFLLFVFLVGFTGTELGGLYIPVVLAVYLVLATGILAYSAPILTAWVAVSDYHTRAGSFPPLAINPYRLMTSALIVSCPHPFSAPYSIYFQWRYREFFDEVKRVTDKNLLAIGKNHESIPL